MVNKYISSSKNVTFLELKIPGNLISVQTQVNMAELRVSDQNAVWQLTDMTCSSKVSNARQDYSLLMTDLTPSPCKQVVSQEQSCSADACAHQHQMHFIVYSHAVVRGLELL